MLYLIVLVCLLAGGGLVWHSIGSAAVEKERQAVRVEQDKIDAVAEAEVNAEEQWLINTQAQHEVDVAAEKVVEKKIYIKGQDFVRETTVFQNKECVVPAQGLAILNAARGDLQNSTAADILGLGQPPPETSVRIIEVPRPVVPPAQATKPPAPAPGTRPPKPVPVPK